MLLKSLFLTLHGHNIHCLQWKLSKFLSAISEFGASIVWCVFLNRAWNLRCAVITDVDISKRGTQKAFFSSDAILETGPAAPQQADKRTAGGSTWETWKAPAVDSICCAV
jgi:hypothetical protein